MVYAVNSANGGERWRYSPGGEILASPAVDSHGAVYVGDTSGNFAIFNQKGGKIGDFSGLAPITQSPVAQESKDVFVQAGTQQLQGFGLLPNHWDGRPDVQATNNRHAYRLVNPVIADMGVDQLHDTRLTQSRNIRGDGVTIAVVDSGIYFDSDTINQLSGTLNKQYLGQADFVDIPCPITPDGVMVGIQTSDYCFITHKHYTRDGYGHGTAVAGAIWNNLYDGEAGLAMGGAPDANVVSVRTLNDDGVGTYETVIRGIQWVVENQQTYNIRILNLSLSANATTPYFIDPLNRATEQAWAAGIVVLAAAGNSGPTAETITVPGNDPFLITVGTVMEPTATPTMEPTVVPVEPVTQKASQPTPIMCPASVTIVAGADTYLNAEKPDERNGDQTQFKTRPRSGKQRIGLLWFDLGAIPVDAELQLARLLITSENRRDDHLIVIRQMTTPWNEIAASWKQSEEKTSWSQGDFSPADYGETTFSILTPEGNDSQSDLDISALATSWLKGAPNYGLLLLPSGNDGKDAKWYSREEAKESRRPQLQIDYLQSNPVGCP